MINKEEDEGDKEQAKGVWNKKNNKKRQTSN